MAVKRAISVDNLLSMTFKEMAFEGEWLEFIGVPEMSGVWLVWGNSGNGKTTFMIKLAKYLCNFGRVAYDTLEEGARKSFVLAAKRVGIREVSRRLTILDREPMDELITRLNKRKSPDIIIIDSFQYSGLTKKSYIELKEQFPKKLFIFVSHAEGKHPEGRAAKFIRYDVDVKIWVEGHRAFPTSRYGGKKPFTIWAEGAKKYYNEIE